MPSKKISNTYKTLLIVLGIIIAYLLSTNSDLFYSANILKNKQINSVNNPIKESIGKKGVGILKIFSEKITSL